MLLQLDSNVICGCGLVYVLYVLKRKRYVVFGEREETSTDALLPPDFFVMVAEFQADPLPFAAQFDPDAQCCTSYPLTPETVLQLTVADVLDAAVELIDTAVTVG